jgi:hypothetical protein
MEGLDLELAKSAHIKSTCAIPLPLFVFFRFLAVAGAGDFLYRPLGMARSYMPRRDFGSPRALRLHRVRDLSDSGGGVLYAKGVPGSGDEALDDEGVESAREPGAERSGVESHISSSASA